MIFTLHTIIFIVVILIGIPLLEWRLSRCTSPLPGLILPIITFTYALLALFSYVAYDGQPLFAVILDLLVVFLMSDIPTLILLAIYFGVRGNMRKKSAIDKMNIQDL